MIDVRKELMLLQDLKYKEFHSALCPGVDNIIGVRVPDIRKLVKKVLKDDYKFYLDNVNNDYYEETMIEGLVIATSKMSLDEKFLYLDKFVSKIDNWAICDTVCASFKFKDNELDEVWKFITKYKNSKNEFELRFMIVMMMDYFLIDKYLDKVIAIIDKVSYGYYYTDMAIAWLISVMFVKNRVKCLNYLNNNNVSIFIYNKTLQKIIESNRVTSSDKEMIRKMKK